MKNNFSAFAIALLLLSVFSCKKKEDPAPENPNATERQAVIDNYNTNYLGSSIADVGWSGSTSSCNPGTISSTAQQKTLQRVNYFRKLVGLNDDVSFDATENTKSQEAALMMDANDLLDHAPPAYWSCYTADGAEAAGSSNLALGAVGPDAITLYMQDAGSGNLDAGHRRWILYSRMKTMGHGCTSSADDLWVFGNSSNPLPSSMPDFVAFPCEGYFPAPLVFTLWSFGIPDADFSSATVSMKDASNNAVSLNVVSTTPGYGDNAIVWQPDNINVSSASDLNYTVTVSNVVVSGQTKNYSYTVTLIQP